MDLNSRIFPVAEVPKTGASLAAPRRMARSARRRLRRRSHRMKRVRSLIVREGILSKMELEALFDKTVSDIYELRFKGLDNILLPDEWAIVLLFFAKHRGFKSNRLAETDNDEEGAIKEAVKANAILLDNYRTVGEMLFRDEKFANHKRNKESDYQMTISRDMLDREIRELFTCQRRLGSKLAGADFEEKYLNIFSSCRNFDEGPGGNSPYGGNLIEKMIGECTLEKGEKRAPKASYSFMRFTLLQKLNNLQIVEDGLKRSLTKDERLCLENLAWQSPSLTYSRLRKELNLPESARFNDLLYSQDIEKTEKKAKFDFTTAYHEIRKVLDKKEKGYINKVPYELLDAIGYAFTAYKTKSKIKSYLEQRGLDMEVLELLLEKLKTFTKFGHISIKACQKLLPYLEQGLTYDKACTAAGYDFQGKAKAKSKFLPGYSEEIRNIPNPVVKRAISQTIKVINAIVRRYGSPVEVHIELAREMARTKNDRIKMKKQMDDNHSLNEKLRNELIENGLLQPSGQDIIKWKLYKEQQGICAYSQKVLDVYRVLHDPNYVEVDHILPYSRSFDDSFSNKVLVLSGENRQKGNRTPAEYLSKDEEKFHRFEIWAKSVRDFRKRQRLLNMNFSKEEMDWKERHLNDTKYISRFVYNFLCENMEFSPFRTERKRHVLAVNGCITAYVRKRLLISKVRENGDLHHAIDAAVIACVTQGVVNKVVDYSKKRELWGNSRSDRFPEPWTGFVRELEARVGADPAGRLRAMSVDNYTEEELLSVKPVFVSRMPHRKVRGSAHDATLHSPKMIDKGVCIKKTPLSKLKLTSDGMAIAGYYNPSSDRLLYDALLKRMQDAKETNKEPFTEPFYKPCADGSQGPLVRKVKIVEKGDSCVSLNKGQCIADNGSMVRVDVFYRKEGPGGKGYYLVPIYVADTVKEKFPMKASTQYKPYSEWINMKPDEYVFSLYKNDLILISSSKGIGLNLVDKNNSKKLEAKQNCNTVLGYYQGMDRYNAQINIINHDNTYKQPSLGVKRLDSIKKMQTDILGSVTEAPKETRRNFHNMKRDPNLRG